MSANLQARIETLKADLNKVNLQIQTYEAKENLDSEDVKQLTELNTKAKALIDGYTVLKETAGHQADLLELFNVKGEEKDGDRKSFGEQKKALADRYRELNRTFEGPQQAISEERSILRDFRGQMQSRALLTGTSDSQAGATIVNQRLASVDDGGLFRPITVLDLCTRIPVTSDIVEYSELATITNAAVETPEATDTTTMTLVTGAMQESDATAAVRSSRVWDVSHYLDMTRNAYNDAPMFRSLCEQFGEYGVMEQLEDSIIQGANTPTTNIVGIRNTSGIQTQAFTTDLLMTARRALTKAKRFGRPGAWVMAPETWESVELSKDAEGRFYYAGPQGVGPAILWGRPVVESYAVPTTDIIIGDWRFAAIFDREEFQMILTNSDASKFRKQILTMAFIGRYGFGLLRRAAFVRGATA
jgi:HK97 family phage major capsid protein